MAATFDEKTIFILPAFWRRAFEEVEKPPRKSSASGALGEKGEVAKAEPEEEASMESERGHQGASAAGTAGRAKVETEKEAPPPAWEHPGGRNMEFALAVPEGQEQAWALIRLVGFDRARENHHKVKMVLVEDGGQ